MNVPERGNNERPYSGARLLLLGLVIAVTLGLLLLSSITVQPKRDEEKSVVLSGLEIAEKTASFLTKTLYDSQSYLFINLLCDQQAKCNHYLPITPEARAWRIMAFAGLFEATRKEEHKRQLEIETREFLRYSQSLDIGSIEDNNLIGNSLHQIMEAYRVVGDRELLIPFFSRADYYLDWMENFDLSPAMYAPLNQVQRVNPMLVSTFARQMIVAYGLLRDPATVAFLQLRGLLPIDERTLAQKKERFLKVGLKSLELVQMVIERFKELGPSMRVLEDMPEFQRDSCWVQWVNSALYDSTKQPRYLDEIKRFFDTFDVPTRDAKKVRINSLQSILPCAVALRELSLQDSSYEQDFRAIFERIILKGWDSEYVPVCDKDHSFLSRPVSLEVNCIDNEKSGTDASWITSILSTFKGSLRVLS